MEKIIKNNYMIKPIRDNVLIEPCESDSISEGGIIVPDSCKERSNKAIVRAVGNGVKDKPMLLSPGMTVFHIKGAGDAIIDNGKTYFLIKQQDALATI